MQAQSSTNMTSKCSCPLPQFTLHLAMKTIATVIAIETGRSYASLAVPASSLNSHFQTGWEKK